MSNILVLDHSALEATQEQRMRVLSRALVWVFTALLGFIAFSASLAFIVSLAFPQFVEIGANGGELSLTPYSPTTLDPGMTWLAALPLSTRIVGIVDVAMVLLPLAFIVLNLRGLFQLYASGIVFARENAQHLKRIGLWLFAYPFAKFAANQLYQAFGGPDRVWFSSVLLFALLLGAIVFVIAQVMAMGHEIEREQAEFI